MIFDVVISHKADSDYTEKTVGIRVEKEGKQLQPLSLSRDTFANDPTTDRTKEITGEPEEIEVHTGFTMPGRNGKYSSFEWNKDHFNGCDCDEITKDDAIWRFQGKQWAPDADKERGNFDFL